jgi:hypothetical protein
MARRDDYDDRDEDREDRFDDDDDRPEYRSDLMAHRGGLILAFGIIAIVSFFFCFLLGLPLGILAWIWGSKDLKAMDAGEMDPEGRGMTLAGMITGIIGTIMNILMTLGMVIYLIFIFVIIGVAAAGK